MVEAIMKKQRQQNMGMNMRSAPPTGKGYGKEMMRLNSGQKGMIIPALAHSSADHNGKLIGQRRQVGVMTLGVIL